jgi:hypothetical protein
MRAATASLYPDYQQVAFLADKVFQVRIDTRRRKPSEHLLTRCMRLFITHGQGRFVAARRVDAEYHSSAVAIGQRNNVAGELLLPLLRAEKTRRSEDETLRVRRIRCERLFDFRRGCHVLRSISRR